MPVIGRDVRICTYVQPVVRRFICAGISRRNQFILLRCICGKTTEDSFLVTLIELGYIYSWRGASERMNEIPATNDER